ncbi:auxilin-like clathrin-binding protein required for normal clathrin function [Sporothrix epigloea]|uniref:Auxilin-like clathrin-binding protein required for normal clathrin function n=1 Tax=Sporothrix epigloea TaxID=1892477 RepID=A0ABP0DCP5_9PEZI
MDDLSGLDWSSSSSSNKINVSKPTLAAQSSSFASYPSLRPTPPPGASSGRSTPLSNLSVQGSGQSNGHASRQQTASSGATAKSGQDSFSGLISFGTNKNPANLSLREQQERLDAERRRKEEEKRKQNQANYGDGQFFDILGRGVGGSGLGSSVSSRKSSPALPPPPTTSYMAGHTSHMNGNGSSGDDDLFAAFDADTKVDQASHFPPQPKSANTTPVLDLSSPSAWSKSAGVGGSASVTTGTMQTEMEDDDLFGLSQLPKRMNTARSPPPAVTSGGDDDDILGDLAKPVEEVRRKTEAHHYPTAQQEQRQKQPEPGKPIEGSDSSSDSDSDADCEPRFGNIAAKTGDAEIDNAIAQLVDYGFSVDDARRGLSGSGRNLDVQAAVNWLLDDAHRQAKAKARAKQDGGRSSAQQSRAEEMASRGSSKSRDGGGPAWMHDPEGISNRGKTRSPLGGPSNGEDFAKTAAAMGTSFLKTANSLWKTGQKQLQKAVQDLQQEGGDPNQPKWMRSAGQEHTEFARPGEEKASRRRAAAAEASDTQAAATATEEAMMLESGARPEWQQHSSRLPTTNVHALDPRLRTDSQASSRTQSPAAGLNSSTPTRVGSTPRWQQGASVIDSRVHLTKQAIEKESAQAYISPARRRKPPPAASAAEPVSKPFVEGPPEGDLLSNSTALPARPAQSYPSAASSSSSGAGAGNPPAHSTPSPRPPRVARQVPQVNSFVLQASAKHRADGAAHFKRGDYAAAHASYTASLTDIPRSHPLVVVLYCNHALTALKTGEPRQAVSDADAALAVIGPGKGEGETVSLEDGTDATRDLKDLYGKAMTRKAEALEQMEKWAEAGQMWRMCVESGVGGAVAIAGRQRCQSALQPKPKTAVPVARQASKPAAPRPTAALGGLGGSGSSTATPLSASGRDFEAVQRLRAANLAAAREDSEKLGLLDQVDARVAAWRDGKKDNLRALLGSLERVLWEGSGWKPVGLHELVMPNKVKIVYMRAIGKTHPDKLPQDASTEVRMIAGTVFSTLNESWDKFKSDNKM